MDVTKEPILSRLDRLDNLMRHLEELKGGGGGEGRSNKGRSPRSSTPSTPSSGTGTTTSDGPASFLDFSPRSRDNAKHPCRPIDDVIVETEYKGTLLDRVARIEDHLFKLQQDMEADKHELRQHSTLHDLSNNNNNKKSFKQFVKSCVTGKASESDRYTGQ